MRVKRSRNFSDFKYSGNRKKCILQCYSFNPLVLSTRNHRLSPIFPTFYWEKTNFSPKTKLYHPISPISPHFFPEKLCFPKKTKPCLPLLCPNTCFLLNNKNMGHKFHQLEAHGCQASRVCFLCENMATF